MMQAGWETGVIPTSAGLRDADKLAVMTLGTALLASGLHELPEASFPKCSPSRP